MEKTVTAVRSPFDGVLLVCQKCQKKLGKEGKAFRKSLKKGVRERFGKTAVRVLKTSCFDVCPKGAMTVAAAGKASPLRIVVVDPKATADDVFNALGMETNAPIAAE